MMATDSPHVCHPVGEGRCICQTPASVEADDPWTPSEYEAVIRYMLATDDEHPVTQKECVDAIGALLAARSDLEGEIASLTEQRDIFAEALEEARDFLRDRTIPTTDEVRELRSAIFDAAVGMPPEAKTSEWADRAQALGEAIDDHDDARTAQYQYRIADQQAEIERLTRERDEWRASWQNEHEAYHEAETREQRLREFGQRMAIWSRAAASTAHSSHAALHRDDPFDECDNRFCASEREARDGEGIVWKTTAPR